MSETVQLDQLLNEKSSVEDGGRKLDEEQRQLKIRARELTEKIIQELKRKNDVKQKNVNLLQFEVNDLESQLNALTASSVLEGTKENVESTEETIGTNVAFQEETSEETAVISEEPQESMDANVASQEDQGIVITTEFSEETDADSKHRKKRKFF